MKTISGLLLFFSTFIVLAQPQDDGYQFSDFDENGLEIPDNPAISMTSDFTVEVWLKPRVILSQMTVLQNGWCGNSDFSWSILIEPDSSLRFVCNAIGNCNYSNAYELDTHLNPEECVHVAFVYTNNSIEAYLDGVLESGSWVLGNHPGILHSSNENMNIGKYKDWGGSWGLYYSGIMDELRIWSDIRTSQEIQMNYSNPLVGDEANLELYYNFDSAPSGDGATIVNEATGTGSSLDATATSLTSLTPNPLAYDCFLSTQDYGLISQDDVLAYPNPARDFVSFELNGESGLVGNLDLTLTVYDAAGRIIDTERINELPHLYSTEKLEVGTYLYSVFNAENSQEFKGKLVIH